MILFFIHELRLTDRDKLTSRVTHAAFCLAGPPELTDAKYKNLMGF
jgi:hypothetical protein